ncbi:MAG TPA: ATP-binding cassette domain-containing protein [Bacteroides sp.]|nr:ATP-binding cassette domain-containing protein [Bacteroides sp.]
MSESILNALMRLFAVFATVQDENVSETGKNIVTSFLLRYLNKEDVIEEYIGLFHDYHDFYRREAASPVEDTGFQTSSLDAENISRICIQIRKELNSNERIIVLFRLIEFVYEDKLITDLEREFVKIVGEAFSIKGDELDNALLFIEEGKEHLIREDYTVVVQSEIPISIEELEGDWIDKNRPEQEYPNHILLKKGLQGEVFILHFKSLNGMVMKYVGPDILTIDGNLLDTSKVYFFGSGSIIRGSGFGAIYYTEVASRFLQSSEGIRITVNAEDIEFRFLNSDNGIRRFSFSEDSGQLIGIMGGSGVGKSTLLMLLSGQLPLTNGKISINNYDLHRDTFKLKGIIGFVPQDDLLFEDLTVYQNLYYNARLCFGYYSEFQLQEVVSTVMNELDLFEIKDLKVGTPLNKLISGGQRKRLNIALELMREPSILFIDEPTSGLSSMDAENVIRLLKEQTAKGKLVIANIHQPNSNIFKMLDKLWVLDKGGFPVYSGNPIDAILYFKKLSSFAEATEVECGSCGHVNPDQILEIVEAKLVDEEGKYSLERKISPETWYEHYQQNIAPEVTMKETKKILPSSLFRIPDMTVQFKVFFIRNLLSKISNRQYILINLLEAPVLAFVLAYFTKYMPGNEYIFSENKNLPAYLFMSVIVAIFIGMIVSAEEIIKDRKVLHREAFLNLSWFSYLNSKLLYLFALSAVQMLLYVLVGNWILEIKGMTLTYWLVLFSTAACANMLGLNISSGMDSRVNIYIIIPLILIPQLLLSGVTVKFDDLHKSLTSKVHVPFIGDLMISRWSFETLAVDQAKSNRFDKNFYAFDQMSSESRFKTSFLIPRLINKLEECNRNLGVEGDQELLRNNLELLSNEVEKLGSHEDLFEFEYLSKLNINDFYVEYSTELEDWLAYIRFYYMDLSRDASQRKEQAYTRLVDSLSSDAVFEMRQKYHNDQLFDQVTNRLEVEKILEVKNRLIQKSDPIYIIPESNLGRAHFYAPFKLFNNQLTDTKWFNITMLWGFSFVLYLALLLNLLRRIINFMNSFRLRKKS